MRLGCSEIEITPNLPINLGGYGGRTQPGNGVATKLLARGFTFEHEGLRGGLITADILMLNSAQVEKIRERASSLTGIPMENIVISCTHTHSGPSPFSKPGLGNPPDETYINWLLKALAGTLPLAGDNMEPVQMGWDSAQVSGVSANRRDPDQDVDRELTVLGFARADGSLKALLMNFPCHPTVLGAGNLKVSSEYPGAATSVVAKLFPGTVVAFINGACGDISTRFVRRVQAQAEVQRLGTVLGARAAAMAAGLEFADAEFSVARQIVKVDLKPLLPEAELDKEIAQWQQRLEDLKLQDAPAAQVRIAQTGWEGARMQKLSAQVRDDMDADAELSIWQLGPVGLVSIPGELFSALGQRIKAESPFAANVIAGYSNGHLGYIPTRQAYEQGGYEPLSSPLAPGFGEKLAAAAVGGLKNIIEKQGE